MELCVVKQAAIAFADNIISYRQSGRLDFPLVAIPDQSNLCICLSVHQSMCGPCFCGILLHIIIGSNSHVKGVFIPVLGKVAVRSIASADQRIDSVLMTRCVICTVDLDYIAQNIGQFLFIRHISGRSRRKFWLQNDLGDMAVCPGQVSDGKLTSGNKHLNFLAIHLSVDGNSAHGVITDHIHRVQDLPRIIFTIGQNTV